MTVIPVRQALSILALMLLPLTDVLAADEPYEYEDRDLWFQLEQQEFDFGEESIAFYSAGFYPEAERPKTLYLFVGDVTEPNNGDAIVVRRLREKTGAAVWFLDTPDALFIDRERIRFRGEHGEFMGTLMDGLGKWFNEVIVITADVGSVPVLRGLRAWQTRATDEQRRLLSQVVLLYPSLYVNTPVAGEDRELFPIAENTALPITIIQPELGAQANTIGETTVALKRGGSLVHKMRLAKTIDGIFKFQDIRERAEAFPAHLTAAVEKMSQRRGKIRYPIYSLPVLELEAPKTRIVSGLKEIKTPYPMPALILKSFEGELIDVAQAHRGKAMLINFWATWCPHCVEEIPSMNRALHLLERDAFEMVSVSYRDTHAIMEDFLTKVTVDFPVLMDSDGEVSKRWKVFAFPSSFLVDKHGMVRYSINAGAIWDNSDLIAVMKKLGSE